MKTIADPAACIGCGTRLRSGEFGYRPCGCLGGVRPGGHTVVACASCGTETVLWCDALPDATALGSAADVAFWNGMEDQFAAVSAW